MSHYRRISFFAVLLAAFAVLAAPLAWGQAVTSGSLAGRVVAEADGTSLPGAQVTAIHLPTGTRYTAVTRSDGRFDMLNVRVGGPYNVTSRMDGFVEVAENEVFVSLGQTTNLVLEMPLETIQETVTVVGEQASIINSSRTGASTNVSAQNIENLPTVERSIQDIAKLSPYFASFGDNGEETVVAVAGRNNRYNNIQIDGAVNNDVFGLASTGTPGGQAETQPISYDAIQEMQLLISPYDVRQGGFTGGGINAITRSGTNAWNGSVYYFLRDDGFVGEGPFDEDIGPFSEDEYGARLGGPIMRDKAFFFFSGEVSALDRPSGFSIDASAPQQFINPAGAQAVRDIATGLYGYDPGGFGEFVRNTESDKFFGRLDVNLSDSHQLVFRHNFVDATNDIYRTGTTSYDFPDRNYNFESETNSTVGQLNSVLSANMFNEARITYQTIRDKRFGDERFPAVTVVLGSGQGTVRFGTEPFSTQNGLDQDIIELSDELNWIVGDHQITLGTANELFEFDNLFIRQNFGEYRFESIADFQRGWASRYDRSFSLTGDPQESANFEVQKYGFYAGDRWQLNRNLNVVYGLRADVPYFPDEPAYNPAVDAAFGYRTDEVADGNLQWSPRVGFNWDIGGIGTQQLRGGVGYFSGRPPYVWISNQYSNSGVEFSRIGSRINGPIGPNNHIPFLPDPDIQYTDPSELGGSAFANEVNLIDPDFEYPQIVRASLGYDRELPWFGLITTAEVLWSQAEQDILYQNPNIVPTGNTTFGGRPTFTRDFSGFGDVILLTNTEKGETLNASIQLEKPFRNGWYAMGSYTYGESESVNDGTSSQAISNWRFLPVQGDPNDPGVSTSLFEVRDRFIASTSYTFDYGSGWGSTVSLVYNAQSGTPYSVTFNNDVNGDGQFTNDLLYIPASADEVEIRGGTWSDFDAFVEAADLGGYRGEIVDRNATAGPWVHRLDLRLSQKVPITRFNVEVALDVLNLANLFDSDSGVVRYVPFGNYSAVSYRGLNAEGKPIYELEFDEPSDRFDIDDLRSRWQAKLGLRLNF